MVARLTQCVAASPSQYLWFNPELRLMYEFLTFSSCPCYFPPGSVVFVQHKSRWTGHGELLLGVSECKNVYVYVTVSYVLVPMVNFPLCLFCVFG